MSRRIGLFAALLAVLGAVVYLNSLQVPFHLDDAHSISDNTWIRKLENVPLFFTDVRTFSPLAENRSYRPLLLVSYALSWTIGGGALPAFHAFSIALHAAMVACLYLGLRRLLA